MLLLWIGLADEPGRDKDGKADGAEDELGIKELGSISQLLGVNLRHFCLQTDSVRDVGD